MGIIVNAACTDWAFTVDELDVRDLPERTFVKTIRAFAETDSTNSVALAWSPQLSRGELPALVVTERQTGGRGRGVNRWWSGPGALTFSLLIEPAEFDVPTSLWPALSLTVGVATALAVQSRAGHADVRVKWPNDVYLNGRKLAGILIESPATSVQRLVIGVGINVNNSLADAPDQVRERAISVRDVLGVELSRSELLGALLVEFETRLQELSAGSEALRAEWRRLCFLTGRSVVITDSGRTVAGTCLGLDDDGALRVQTGQSIERLFSGVVTDFQ